MAQLQNTPRATDSQMEALKNYGSYIVSAIILALAGYFGWTYWQEHHARVDTVAADQFADIQQLNNEVSLAAQNPDLENEAKSALAANQTKLDKDIAALVAAHGDTIYAWQALMIKARQQADNNDYKSANQTLKQALAINLEDAGLKAITQLRYAQTLLASGDASAALDTLQAEMPDAFEASKQELLGDVYIAQGKKDQAIKAYTNAWELLRKRQESRAVLALKMDSLGITADPIEPPASLVTAPTSAPLTDANNAVDDNINANANANAVDNNAMSAAKENEVENSSAKKETQETNKSTKETTKPDTSATQKPE